MNNELKDVLSANGYILQENGSGVCNIKSFRKGKPMIPPKPKINFEHNLTATIIAHYKAYDIPYHVAKKQVEDFIYANTVHRLLNDEIIDVFVNPDTGYSCIYDVVSTLSSAKSIILRDD